MGCVNLSLLIVILFFAPSVFRSIWAQGKSSKSLFQAAVGGLFGPSGVLTLIELVWGTWICMVSEHLNGVLSSMPKSKFGNTTRLLPPVFKCSMSCNLSRQSRLWIPFRTSLYFFFCGIKSVPYPRNFFSVQKPVGTYLAKKTDDTGHTAYS